MTTTAPTPEMTPVPAPQEVVEPPKPAPRLVSLDALRGFDMFWIIGADALTLRICDSLRYSTKHPKAAIWAGMIYQQMDHVDWRGFHFYDLIFPMFVFIVGVSLVFSLSKAMERGGRARAVRRVILRGIILYVFGLLYYGGLSHAFGGIYRERHQPKPPDAANAFMAVITDFRFMGVLQRIAIAYLFTGLLFCFFRARAVVLVSICAILLLGYWALLAFAHSPGQPQSYEEGANIVNYVDAHHLPGFKWDGDHDPEGLLSNIPAVGGCLLGVFAGLLLQSQRFGGYQKAGLLVVVGAIFIAVGAIWGGIPLSIHDGGWTLPAGAQFPVIKKLWTSSFVLLTAGCSSVLLGLFYLVVDVWRQRWIVTPFVWIGMNAITLYLVWKITDDMKGISSAIVGFDNRTAEKSSAAASTLAQHLPPNVIAIVQPAVALLLILLLARFLYKRQIFLRV